MVPACPLARPPAVAQRSSVDTLYLDVTNAKLPHLPTKERSLAELAKFVVE
jgi:hypothetical protein